jgi:hypothetical protein
MTTYRPLFCLRGGGENYRRGVGLRACSIASRSMIQRTPTSSMSSPRMSQKCRKSARCSRVILPTYRTGSAGVGGSLPSLRFAMFGDSKTATLIPEAYTPFGDISTKLTCLHCITGVKMSSTAYRSRICN